MVGYSPPRVSGKPGSSLGKLAGDFESLPGSVLGETGLSPSKMPAELASSPCRVLGDAGHLLVEYSEKGVRPAIEQQDDHAHGQGRESAV